MAVDKLFGNIIVKAVGERRLPMRRFTGGGGQVPRYMNVPRNVSEISKFRSSLYTFSVAAGDVTSLVPGKFLPNVRNTSLKIARTLGDFNAINKTMQRLGGAQVGGAVGERFGRRVVGRAAGSVVRQVPGDNPVSRMVRSKMGATFQRQQKEHLGKSVDWIKWALAESYYHAVAKDDNEGTMKVLSFAADNR